MNRHAILSTLAAVALGAGAAAATPLTTTFQTPEAAYSVSLEPHDGWTALPEPYAYRLYYEDERDKAEIRVRLLGRTLTSRDTCDILKPVIASLPGRGVVSDEVRLEIGGVTICRRMVKRPLSWTWYVSGSTTAGELAVAGLYLTGREPGDEDIRAFVDYLASFDARRKEAAAP